MNQDEGYDADGGDDVSSTTSADSTNLVIENERIYSGAPGERGQFLPIDEPEKDHFDFVHHIDSGLLGRRLYISPLMEPHNALDVVTGTGIWAIEFADENPGCAVIGIHISKMQPGWVPPNCEFQLYDMNEDWTFKENRFCFVRANNTTFDIRNHDHLCHEAFRVLRKGGYCELSGVSFEVKDCKISSDSPLIQFIEKLVNAGNIVGLDLRAPANYKQYLVDAGFSNIQEEQIEIPFTTSREGRRSKDVARWNYAVLNESLETMSSRLFSVAFKQTADETREEVANVLKAVLSSNTTQYWTRHIVCAQKAM